MDTTRLPAEVFPPGDMIREELEARGWSQQDLAAIMGTNHALVSEIVNSKRAITPETAVALSRAFGTSPELWMNLEASYQLSQIRQEPQGDQIAVRARLYEKAPVKDMIKRGWIAPSKDASVLAQRILAFFERKTLDEDFAFVHAARKSSEYGETTPSQWAWLHRAKQMARTLHVRSSWKPNRKDQLLGELRALTQSSDAAQDVSKVLAAFGVRLVIVQSLPTAKMDGASFWLAEDAPVIAVSLRYDRIDNFWHTVMHELGHVLHGDKLSIDLEVLSRGNKPERERQADQFAVESLVPQAELDDFCLRVAPLFSHVKVLGFAARIRVHPGIVVGQLHHRGPEERGLDYSYLRKLLTPIRRVLMRTTLTDGWGSVVPV